MGVPRGVLRCNFEIEVWLLTVEEGRREMGCAGEDSPDRRLEVLGFNRLGKVVL